MDQERRDAPTAGLMKQAEAAAYLDLAPLTLQAWRATGRTELPYIKLGRLVRYRREDLDAFVSSRWRCTTCSQLLPGRTAAQIEAGASGESIHGCVTPPGQAMARLELDEGAKP